MSDPLTEKLLMGLAKVRRVAEATWEGPVRREALSIDDLKDTVESMYKIKVDMQAVKYAAVHTKSLVERWPGSGFVAVQWGQGEPMLRYSAVKELCHLIVDEPEDYSPQGCSTVDGLLYAERLNLNDPAVRSEKIAEHMADELLYPQKYRVEDSLAIKVPGSGTSIGSLAVLFNVPDFVPSRVLRPLNLALFADLAKQVDKIT